jgi:hypothetical protein
MTVAPNVTYVVRWSAEVAVVPLGASSMEVPCAQRLKLQQNSPSAGGTIVVASTGLYPTSTNFTTAFTTAGTNMGTAFTQTGPLAQIQGFATGGG